MTTPQSPKVLGKGPPLKWIKNDPKKYQWFEDGTVFLTALQVRDSKTGKTEWEYDKVRVSCDGDYLQLYYSNSDAQDDETYDRWNFEDFEYFAVLEGQMPEVRP